MIQLNNFPIIPFHMLKSIDLIPNKTGFEYHATSIANYIMQHPLPFSRPIVSHSILIFLLIPKGFQFQSPQNLSMISKLLLLTRPIVSHSILSGFQFHVNKLSMTSILFLHRRSIDFNIYYNSKSMACIMI